MRSVDVLLIVAAFLVSAAITGVMKLYAQGADLLDVPNQRSSHEVVTPRGGGLSIVIVFLGTVVAFLASGQVERSTAIAFLLGGVLIAGIGFADDHGHVSAKWRFLVQVVASAIIVTTLGGLPEFPVGETTVHLGISGDVLLIVFMVWFTNAFNFMDGIDGIAASEAVCIAGGAFVIGLPVIGSTSLLAAIMVAASLGFLAWNWPPAKIFMGDVGSAFLGLMLIGVGLYSAHQDFVSLWSWLILSGVFFVDSTVTLLTRILRGDDWLSAHRSHAYQRSARRLGSHARVTVGVIAINACWLLPIAFAANKSPGHGWWLLVAAWLPLIGACTWLGAGRQDAEAPA